MVTNCITIRKPDDFHVHLRSGSMLKSIVNETAKNFARAIIMPNLRSPITQTYYAKDYKNEILSSISHKYSFSPLMTLYLTENTNLHDLVEGYQSGIITAVKYYPIGATTNSDFGIQNLNKVMHILEIMSEFDIPLCIHGEMSDSKIDIFDREKIFINEVIDPLHNTLPHLRIIIEHISTNYSVEYILSNDNNIAATITPHHLSINRNAMLSGGIHTHMYCLPVVKRETDRLSLIKAATSGDSRFFLGTDSAPHFDSQKETHCGCAGIFNSTYAVQIITQIFDNEQSLDKLEAFLSINGAQFYKLALNNNFITLKKHEKHLVLKKKIITSTDSVTIFDPGFKIFWDYLL